MSDNLERMLPNDINAEAAIISAMMIDNSSVAQGVEMLQEKHFYKTTHRILFKAIADLFNEDIEVDIITLSHKLEEMGQLDKIGGRAYINEISDIVLSAANLEYHANIVKGKATLRELITASNQIIKMAYEQEHPIRDILDWSEQKIFEIAEMPDKKTLVRVSEVINEAQAHIEETSQNQTNVLGIPTGFPALDKKIGGFRKGQFVIIASRPAMGKSSFALNIATYATRKRNAKVAIFTLEMSNEELLYRLISSEAQVSMETLLNGYGMDNDKMGRITQVVMGYTSSNYPIYIDDNGYNTVMNIKAKTRRLKAELKGLDLIIIDYLQLMSSPRNSDSRQQEISEISRGLKVLAKDMEVPVIALSQLSRKVEDRKDDKRPLLSDIRESGAIEQDADIVMFLYRDDYYNKESEKPGVAEVIIAKNRHGAIGTVDLKFVGEYTKFENIDDPNF